MKLREIKTLNQLEAEKARLNRQLKKSGKRVDTAYIIAKRHTKHKFSAVELVKAAAGKLFSAETLLSNPVAVYKIGTSIGKRLFSKKKK